MVPYRLLAPSQAQSEKQWSRSPWSAGKEGVHHCVGRGCHSQARLVDREENVGEA